MTDDPPVLAVLVSFSGAGGVERMMLNLLHGFTDRGVSVDLLTVRAESEHLTALPDAVRVLDLGARHNTLAVPALTRYLRRRRPAALLAAKDRGIRAAALACRLAGVRTRLVGRIGTNLSAALAGKPAPLRWWRQRPLRRGYARVDHVVAVSAGVAADVCATTGLPAARVSVIRNPVITPELAPLAAAAVDHPWFNDDGPPVLLGAGRLTRQKDFATLIRAFALLRQRRPARLMILGEGRLRNALQSLSAELGVADAVALPGFDPNPYRYLARADVFVLSSVWEGSPNVLTEALALGTPAVATDCPSGPREVLRDGAVAPLVAVGDAAAMAAAVDNTLTAPPPAERLRQAVADYTLAASSAQYLKVLGMPC